MQLLFDILLTLGAIAAIALLLMVCMVIFAVCRSAKLIRIDDDPYEIAEPEPSPKYIIVQPKVLRQPRDHPRVAQFLRDGE